MNSKSLTFGRRLKELRQSRGQSPRDFAARVRIKPNYLERLERDSGPPPSSALIIDLARALCVDHDELFALAGKIPPEIENVLRASPLLVQMVRLARQWPTADLRTFLASHDVPESRLQLAACANPLQKTMERRPQRENITAELRRAVFSADDYECVYCSSRALLEVDHIFPHSLGGTNDFENLITSCSVCNRKKKNREVPFVMVFGRFRLEVNQI